MQTVHDSGGIRLAAKEFTFASESLFQRSFTWVQEVSIIAAMWVYFFAYGLIAKDEEYIRVDVVADLLGPRARRAVTIAARIANARRTRPSSWYSRAHVSSTVSRITCRWMKNTRFARST